MILLDTNTITWKPNWKINQTNTNNNINQLNHRKIDNKSKLGKYLSKYSVCVIEIGLLFSFILTLIVPFKMKKLLILTRSWSYSNFLKNGEYFVLNLGVLNWVRNTYHLKKFPSGVLSFFSILSFHFNKSLSK